MSRPVAIWLFLALWALMMVLSVAAPMFSNDDAVGLDAGLKRLSTFVGFQFIATVDAIILLILSRGLSVRLKWLARVPAALALALVLGILGLIAWANLMRPEVPAYVPPGPVTQPAAPVPKD